MYWLLLLERGGRSLLSVSLTSNRGGYSTKAKGLWLPALWHKGLQCLSLMSTDWLAALRSLLQPCQTTVHANRLSRALDQGNQNFIFHHRPRSIWSEAVGTATGVKRVLLVGGAFQLCGTATKLCAPCAFQHQMGWGILHFYEFKSTYFIAPRANWPVRSRFPYSCTAVSVVARTELG